MRFFFSFFSPEFLLRDLGRDFSSHFNLQTYIIAHLEITRKGLWNESMHYRSSVDVKEWARKWDPVVAVGKGLLSCLALGSKPKNVKEDFTKSIHGVWVEAPWGGLVTSFWTIVAFENISVLKSTIVPVQTSIFKIKSKGQWEMISSPFHSGLSAPWFASLLTKIIGFLFPLAPSPPNHRVNAVL